jgi:hypothetical protein
MSTIIRYILPAILVPMLSLAAAPASAASLEISNGFLTSKSFTDYGYDFSMSLSGTIVNNAVSKATSLELDCMVAISSENIDCDGTLTLDGATADIRMDFDGDSGTAYWAIESSASNALDVTHEAWGEVVVPETLGLTDPFASIDFFNGTEWRKFYYSTTWAATYTSITGLPYGDIWTL